MKNQPQRLGIETPHLLGGTAIDRQRPLRFRLNGRTIYGFGGDTVLSAALASGINAIGTYRGEPLALSERFAPAVVDHSSRSNDLALPMARTPAIDGLDLSTLGSSAGRDLFDLVTNRRRQSLGLQLDTAQRLIQPWLDMTAEPGAHYDLIVVGGGAAGMSAAVAAAKAGSSVVLLERQPTIGGQGTLFGTMEGEETPLETTQRLQQEIAAQPGITILTRAEVIFVRPGRVQVHVVEQHGSRPVGRMLAITGGAIILATGSIERLPVFAGNRLPGVIGAADAFERARRYGVWSGSSAVIATAASAPYRLAMQASDAGIAIERIADTRAQPQSRFIEFAKAYGMTQAAAMAPLRAVAGGRAALAITLQLAFDGYHREEPAIAADQLIVNGGWQPELSLWHAAGGMSRWSAEHNRLEPEAGPAAIVLAGAAAGWFSKQACLQSGADAVNQLFNRKRKPVIEKLIDAVYETPDGATPVSKAGIGASAYLDGGASLIALPRTKPSRWPLAKAAPWSLASEPQAFGINDIAAGVQLGAIAAEQAGAIAMERTPSAIELAPLALAVVTEPENPGPTHLVPPYLTGRFGPSPHLWTIQAREPRAFDIGSLIYLNSDGQDPRKAIGVVVGSKGMQAVALIGLNGAKPGDGITVNDQRRPIAASVVASAEPEESAPALSGGAGAL